MPCSFSGLAVIVRRPCRTSASADSTGLPAIAHPIHCIHSAERCFIRL
jgi:hypothetical protein